jgi:hypothetical protein
VDPDAPDRDSYLRPHAIILANACNGKLLTETEGPWRLIVKDDGRHRRWLRFVTGIVIHNADVAEAQSTKKIRQIEIGLARRSRCHCPAPRNLIAGLSLAERSRREEQHGVRSATSTMT